MATVELILDVKAPAWVTGNTTVLSNKEPAFLTDGRFAFGDGVTQVQNLTFYGGAVTTPTLTQVLTAGNTTSGDNINISTGDSILYNSVKFLHAPVSSTNTSVGSGSMLAVTTGVQNTALGNGVLPVLTTGNNNNAFGVGALASNTTGSNNIANGVASMSTNVTGSYNIAIGELSLYGNKTSNNLGIGYTCLYNNQSGQFNAAVGFQSLYNTTGGNNTALGYNTGLVNTTGSQNTFIGCEADAGVNNLTNATAIGYQAIVSVSNAVVLGNNANVGIGISSPTYKLHVVGSGSFTDLYSGSLDIIATGGTDTLNIGTGNADVINIGRSGATVNILGTALYEYAANQYVLDKLITLNYNGAAASAVGTGFEIEENSIITGYFKTNSTRNGYDILSPAIAYKSNLSLASLTADRTHTLPDASGTLISTGDTGTVTNGMLAGSIAYSKLSLTGSIVNADISASAAIAYSKLALTGSIVNADMGLTWVNYGNSLAATGYSGSVTYLNSRYMKIGKICILQVFFTGTSNANTCTITLPFAAANNVGENQVSLLAIDNNGTKTTSNGFTTANSSTMTIQGAMLTSNAWSVAGTKTVCGVITYETI
jgi:hypothetical protein